ncbi:MAG: hypothetical protein U0838_00160 [Chloroflexota bacterium]
MFRAAVEATEAAIVNALLAGETMTGRDGITAHKLPDRLIDIMAHTAAARRRSSPGPASAATRWTSRRGLARRRRSRRAETGHGQRR